mmetsp:Transcript_19135/g.45633  ORF Transcript_19135/g.45633 Transcript_19135/m.45633 type:complete len:304 (+) Transcript_19135:510-1421(+)
MLAALRRRGKRSQLSAFSPCLGAAPPAAETPASAAQASSRLTMNLMPIPEANVSGPSEKGSTASSRFGKRYCTSARAPGSVLSMAWGSGRSTPPERRQAKRTRSIRRIVKERIRAAISRACPPACHSPGEQSLARTASRASSQRSVATLSSGAAPPGAACRRRWPMARRLCASELATEGTRTRHHTVCSARSKRCSSSSPAASQVSSSVRRHTCSRLRQSPPPRQPEEMRARRATQLLHQNTRPATSSPRESAMDRMAFIAACPKWRPREGPRQAMVRARRRAGWWLLRVLSRRLPPPWRRAQ